MTANLVQLPISRLEGTQLRARMSDDKVEEYAANLEEMPPVVAFTTGKRYWLADGFHRLAAHRVKGRKTIIVDAREGTERDALLFALQELRSHVKDPVAYTNDDKRRAVTLILDDAELGKWTNTMIASECAVTEGFVRKLRLERSSYCTSTKKTANVDDSGDELKKLAAWTADRLKKLPPEKQKEVISQMRRAAAEAEADKPPCRGKRKKCKACGQYLPD